VDSLGTPPGGTHYMPVDAKAFAQSTMDEFLSSGILAYPHYAWQQSAYCEGFSCNKFCLPLWNRDTSQLTVKVYDTHPFSYEEIQDRIFDIEDLASKATPIGDIPCPASWGCPYDYLHDVKGVDTLPEAAESLLVGYLIARKKIETYQKAREVIGDLILKALPEDQATSTYQGIRATVSLVKNAKRIDTQKVKELLVEAGLNPDDYYVPGVGKHIVVKEKRNDASD
jgi:hypothetical protein